MPTYRPPKFRIEIRTGDKPPAPEWLELRSASTRYRFADEVDAVRMMERLKGIQPHSELRVAPM